LARRGYQEVERAWHSSLDVGRFDFAPFTSAPERVARQGIQVTTIDREQARNSATDRAIDELFIRCAADEPTLAPVTPLPFEELLARELNVPEAIPEATFLAKDGERFVGVSSLLTMDALPDKLDVGFAGVHPGYRGRGIAMALKPETVRYARAHGYRRTRTGNHSRNAPMLRINLALGFAREPAWITLQRAFGPRAVEWELLVTVLLSHPDCRLDRGLAIASGPAGWRGESTPCSERVCRRRSPGPVPSERLVALSSSRRPIGESSGEGLAIRRVPLVRGGGLVGPIERARRQSSSARGALGKLPEVVYYDGMEAVAGLD
jgi:GNAT superfamily N-acetyltransferase